ncbi:MAG: hypothetical protein N2053_11050, partial [Chitinispirillaceae bacterium]|nr:hypothetical protein [Chitinispirillaceae bacterium]
MLNFFSIYQKEENNKEQLTLVNMWKVNTLVCVYSSIDILDGTKVKRFFIRFFLAHQVKQTEMKKRINSTSLPIAVHFRERGERD